MSTQVQDVTYTNWRWVRSADDAWLGGVCAGLAKQFNQPAWLIRLAWFLSVWAFGFGVALYLMCWISFPRIDRLEKAHEKVVLGVCARIGRRGDMEVGLARLVALTLLITTFGSAIVGYIVLHFVISENSSSNTQKGQTL